MCTMTDVRDLSVEDAAGLHAGADHYRAFVGPPGRFDLMSSAQFSLLHMLGLRETHRVLDFGCGSLRLGRLLIPYLRPSGYFGVEPEAWLVEEGFARELGEDARRLKTPHIAHNDDYACDSFGQTFDFIVAQSIFSHTGMDAGRRALTAFRSVLADGGLVLANWLIGEEQGFDPDTAGWVYPECVIHAPDRVAGLIAETGLVGRPCGWHHHGGLTWYVLAKREEDLPGAEFLDSLRIPPFAKG